MLKQSSSTVRWYCYAAHSLIQGILERKSHGNVAANLQEGHLLGQRVQLEKGWQAA